MGGRMKLSCLAAMLAALTLAAPVGGQITIGPPAATPPEPSGPALPGWMAGTWAMESGASWADEMWTDPRDGLMLGIGRSGFGAKVESWEMTRIVRKADGAIVFVAQPKGAPPTEFPLAVMSAQAIEFANPRHDYPQKIRYWREGQLLMAETSKMDGSEAVRWNYRPVTAPPVP